MISSGSLFRRGTVPEGIRVQSSVIGALLLRELHTRYGRRGLGYLWLILEPLVLAVAVILIKSFRHSNQEFPGIDVVPFVIVGYVNFVMFRSIFNRAESALDANAPLLYHRMVTILDILVARALLEAGGTAATFILLMSFAVFLDHAEPPARLFELIVGFILLWWWSFSLSLSVCAWTYDNPTLQKFVHPISYILLPMSGAFYMVQWLPNRFHGFMQWWPMACIFEELRYGQFEAASNRYTAVPFVLACCLVLTFLGLLSLGELRRKIALS
jgi:capsular polysaccharide transport system permease protein